MDRAMQDGRADEADDAADREELGRSIDALMAMRPRSAPSIIVVGDDAVFGITPARRPDPDGDPGSEHAHRQTRG